MLYINKSTLTVKQTVCPTVIPIGVHTLIKYLCLFTYVCAHSHQLEGPTTKRNEGYIFTQPDVQVYDDASSTQPTLTKNMYALHKVLNA